MSEGEASARVPPGDIDQDDRPGDRAPARQSAAGGASRSAPSAPGDRPEARTPGGGTEPPGDFSHALLNTLLTNAPVGLSFFDEQLRYVRINEALATMNGRTVEAHLGRRVIDVLPGIGETVQPLLAQVLRSGKPISDVEVSGDTASGLRRHALASYYPVFDASGRIIGVGAVVLDITERKRAEDALRFLAEASTVLASSLDYGATLANVARLAVPLLADWCLIDLVAEDRSIEQVAVAHVDRHKDGLLRELRRRYPLGPDSPHGYPHVIRTGQPEFVPSLGERDLEALSRDEEQLALLRALGLTALMVVPLVARGRTIGAITLSAATPGRHYTRGDLALAEDLARRAAAAIDTAILHRELRDAINTRDEFLATVSHELRTPLTAILGWAQMLRKRKLDPDVAQQALETIERNARFQAQLIDDMLDVSRIITGKLRLEMRPIDLGLVIAGAVETVRPAADARGVHVEVESERQVGPVLGDPTRLQQVAWNLLSNAIKFTPRGGRVKVTLARDAAHALITVTDTGQGISPEFLPHVFERFRQADSSSTRRHGGLGLGLAIVRHLVELHGGTVHADSAGLGRGSTFTVELPLAVGAAEAGAAEST